MPASVACLRLALAGLAVCGLTPGPALADPVICTTSLEAPLASGEAGGRAPSGPVEVTRCGVLQTQAELMQQRAFTWRTSFARGVSLSHQITDTLGIAMGGRDGTRVMGFGFPDQAILWDSSAISNTTAAMLEEQTSPIPWRSADLPSAFTSSLQMGQSDATVPFTQSMVVPYTPAYQPVRGLW